MKQILKHRGYYGEVYYSIEDECYVGRVLGIVGMIAVHEDTSSETAKELIEAIDEYLMFCEDEGRIPIPTASDVARKMESYFEHGSHGSPLVISVDKELAIAH